jgi:hypothetical protein
MAATGCYCSTNNCNNKQPTLGVVAFVGRFVHAVNNNNQHGHSILEVINWIVPTQSKLIKIL